MSDQLLKFDPLICEDTGNAISSQESASGRMPCADRVGQIIGLSGQVLALANLSAARAKEVGLLTSGTYGLHSTGSSRSADLQQSLENRLRVRTQTLGSILYQLTWKPWDTGSGRSRSRLRASVRRTSEIESIGSLTGWVTATARDWKDSGVDIAPRSDTGKERFDQLPRQANLAGWLTILTSSGQKDGVKHTHTHIRPSSADTFWSDADWLFCRDARWRPVEPGTFPLAHGAPSRMGRLRAYGNAICAEQAKEFIGAYLDEEAGRQIMYLDHSNRLLLGAF